MAQPVEKIYSLKTLGYDQIITELDALAKKFVEIKKAKQDAAKTAAEAKKTQGEESQAYKDAVKLLDEQKVKELELKAAIKEKTNEAKAAQLVRQEEINQQKAAIAGNNAEVNSIAAIRKERAELNAAVIRVDEGNPVQFRGQTLQYDEAITKLKQLSAVEQAFRRQFQQDGTLVGEYTTGIIQAFKKMGIEDLVRGQVTRAGEQLTGLNREFEVLKQELSEVRVNGQGSFEGIEKQLIDNRKAALALEQQIGTLQTELRGTGDIGNQITTGLANGFKNMKGQLAGFLLSYVGFQAAFQGIVSGIDTAKELSDQTTNLEIELGKTAGGANDLVAALGKLNTRTKLTDLEAIANIAAKAGVSEQNLLGVTGALDKIKIAFGKDFGDVETGTESLVKLINVFEGTDQVTGENLLRVGNAVRTLANETVASVPFLNDFSKRMAGLKGISDISLPAVLGLASGFEQFGQSSEVAGTTLTRVIPKLATNTAKYAEVAHMTQQAFADLLKNNPAEALIRVSEALVKGKGGIEEISTSFADSQLGSGRIASILGTVGAKADDFRKAIASAGAAYQDTTNIETAFAAKNENLASTIDKISKAFADTANSKAFQATITGISEVLLTLIKIITAIPFGVILAGLTGITAVWAYYKGNVISATIAQSANNEATLLGSVRLGLMKSGLMGAAAAEKARAIISAQASAQRIAALEAEIAAEMGAITAIEAKIAADASQATVLGVEIAERRAHVAALTAEIVATEGATVATEALNVATKASPLGIILTLVAIAIPALAAFGRANSDAASKVSLLSDGLRIQGDIEASMREQTTKTKNSVNELISIIKTEVTNQDLRKKAYQELIRIAPEFTGTLDAEYNATDKLIGIYDKFIAQLDKVSRAQSIRTLKQKYDNDLAEKQNNEFQAKIAADEEARQNKVTEAQNKTIANEGLSSNSLGGSGAAFAKIKKIQTDKQEAYKQAQAEAAKARDAAQGFTKFMEGASEDDKKALIEGLGGNTTAPTGKTGGEIGLEELQQQKAAIDAQIAQLDQIKGKTKVQLDQLKLLRQQRAEINKEIKELGGSATPKAPSLSAADKDVIAQEDTKRDLLLTLEKKSFVTRQETEETYLNNVLKINQDSIDKKLSLIKGDGTAEKKLRAELQLQRITQEQETITKIQELHNKEFSERQTVLRNQLDQDVAAAKEANAIIQEDPNKSYQQKAQSKLDSDNKILDLYKKFNANVDLLEKQLAQQTTRNSREIVKAQQQTAVDVIKDRTIVENARIEDIQHEGEMEVTQINGKYEETRTAILRNERLTSEQRTFLLERLAAANKVTVLTTELETLQQEFDHKTLMYAQDLISDETYLKAKTELKKKQADLEEAMAEASRKRVQDLLDRKAKSLEDLTSREAQKGAIKLFNIDEKDQEDAAALVGAAVAGSFALATDAMHNYYDAERQRIQDSLALNLERLDQEKQQVEARAQSQAEIDSIEKQYAQKKKDAQKAAGEEIKKSKRAELKIALVTEIANDAVAAAAYPFPFNLGIFAVMAGLAYGRYALGLSQINAQQFEKGGQVPRRGGSFGGRPHSKGGTPFKYQGEEYEAEVDELAIIRTRNAPARNKIFQIAGTHQQIASQLNVLGGGVSFAPGAKLKRFETGGFLGTNLQSPVFVPSSNNGGGVSNNKELLEELRLLRGDQQTYATETSKRFERIEVVQVTSSVTAAQKKQVQQKAIGTL